MQLLDLDKFFKTKKQECPTFRDLMELFNLPSKSLKIKLYVTFNRIAKIHDFFNANESILQVQNKINNRPRKRFDYETPIFVMDKLLFNDKVAFVS